MSLYIPSQNFNKCLLNEERQQDFGSLDPKNLRADSEIIEYHHLCDTRNKRISDQIPTSE